VDIHFGGRGCALNIFYVCRISDRGGGIRHDVSDKIWDYGFTSSGYCWTASKTEDVDYSIQSQGGLFDALMENRAAGKMHG